MRNGLILVKKQTTLSFVLFCRQRAIYNFFLLQFLSFFVEIWGFGYELCQKDTHHTRCSKVDNYLISEKKSLAICLRSNHRFSGLVSREAQPSKDLDIDNVVRDAFRGLSINLSASKLLEKIAGAIPESWRYPNTVFWLFMPNTVLGTIKNCKRFIQSISSQIWDKIHSISWKPNFYSNTLRFLIVWG